ncbi:MAG TPA: DUF1697 domain-containing protein [Gaiellales bacterium]|jgi:uncharacterized protein (DUF1697 family)|nr:DUF1697 domain-containing protein [Gaiellales bacterium]
MAPGRRTHVALLRGINVLGRNKISMPVLRELVESLGHTDVVTYIQSGNVAFSAARPDADSNAISDDLQVTIAERTGMKPAVIVVRAAELAAVVGDNPYPDVSDHRLLHAVFLPEPPDQAGLASVAAAVERAREKGSRDDARVVGRVLYLSTPDGFAPSVLRRELDRVGGNRTPARDGSARNWATVTALATLVRLD